MVVFERVKKEAVKWLLQKGFFKEPAKTIYEEARLKKNGLVLILYTSGKLLLQGKPEAVEKIAAQLRERKIGEEIKSEKFRRETGWVIGSDEALKGDTFGGLTVAAVKADDELRQKLRGLGVADSKKLSDQEIIPLARQIREIASCEVRSLLPEEYNAQKNVTEMLNRLHQECARFLFPGKHLIDKYPGCRVGNVQEEKAESKYVEVAAASVLARAAALEQLNYLSTLAGFPLPKGSTHVKLALMELKERGKDFRKFVKIDFRNVKEFLD